MSFSNFRIVKNIFQLCSFPLQAIIADYEEALGRIDDPDSVRQLRLVMDGLRLSASLLRLFLTFCVLLNFGVFQSLLLYAGL